MPNELEIKLKELLENTTGIALAINEIRNFDSKIKETENKYADFENKSHDIMNKIDIRQKDFNDKYYQFLEILEKQKTEFEIKYNQVLKLQKEISETQKIIDYSVPHSINYLYNKYKNTNTPVIVRKIAIDSKSKLNIYTNSTVWSDDYCFYVKNINNGVAEGDYYCASVLQKNTKYASPKIDVCVYVLYDNQEEIQKIIKNDSK